MTEQVPSKDLATRLDGLAQALRLSNLTADAKLVQEAAEALRASNEPDDDWCNDCREAHILLSKKSVADGELLDRIEMAIDGREVADEEPDPPPSPSPLTKVACCFAGKVKDSYILKLWFESQEDLDAAFDMVDDCNTLLPMVPDSDPTKSGEQT